MRDSQKKQVEINQSIQDTSGLLSQSTAAASSGAKLKISTKLQQAFDTHKTKNSSGGSKGRLNKTTAAAEQGKNVKTTTGRQGSNKVLIRLKPATQAGKSKPSLTVTTSNKAPQARTPPKTNKFSNFKAPASIPQLSMQIL